MVQTVFGRLLHRLRVGEIGSGGFFLARGIQELVVGLLNSVNHAAVCVIEREIRCQGLDFGSIDSAGPRAEGKDGVIQIQSDLKLAGSITEETICEERLVAVKPSKSG